MADRAATWRTYTVTASPTDSTETVIATLAGVSDLYSGQTAHLVAQAAFTAAASTASAVFKIRRTSVSGTTVYTSPTFNGADITTPKETNFTMFASDTIAGDSAGATYVLTVTLASAGGATTIDKVFLSATVGSP